MTMRLADTAETGADGLASDDSVIFGTSASTLVTEGIFSRINTPAADAQNQTGSLQQDIARIFAEARAAGIDDPIVVGSIPFDTTKPSSLLVPRRHQFLSLKPDRPAGAKVPAERLSVGDDGRASFQGNVHSLLALMEEGAVQKVVLSRMLDVPLQDGVDAKRVLAHILRSSPNGYRFSVPLNAEETLIGVSPELLLEKRGECITSNPLAGSISRALIANRELANDHLMNSAKERFEHQVVVDQVRDVLQSYCMDLDVPTEPSLLSTPTLWHLSTVVKGVLTNPAVNSLALASALHPTPAVCGYPRDLARAAIYNVENFDRGLFTGITGWMNARGDGEWVVTIRCGIIRKASARVFAGAGIVPGSRPEQEWEETSAKMTLMLQALYAAEAGAL